MERNTLLLDVLNRKKVSRPPIWVMRQAGRILPEYREIRASLSGFKELVETPDLAAEVTIQPVDILGVDAAIIFSDILVIPEAMGLPYQMVEKVGPRFPDVIESESDIDKLLDGDDAASQLDYVYAAVAKTAKRLNGRVPLIGFAGAPWTIMCYMIEGKGSKTFSKPKAMLYKRPDLAHKLLNKITESTISYLKLKANAGAQVLQIFDSWAGVLNRNLYQEFCLPYLKRIVDALSSSAPVILFSKGAYFSLNEIAATGCQAVGLDWTIDAITARKQLGNDIIMQGNLDPCTLYGDNEKIKSEVIKTIQNMGRNHIFNLGHGVYPDTPYENVKYMIDCVKSMSYDVSNIGLT